MRLAFSLLALAASAATAFADDPKHPASVSLSDSPEAALKKFSVAPGLEAMVWASEPLLANPVALDFDNQGRAYVAETYRRRSSVPDIRRNEPWTLENLALRSVEEREAFLKSKHPETARRKPTPALADLNGDGQFDWRDWALESERVVVIEDANRDGRGDASRVLAGGFHSLVTGVGAGVLAHGGEVFYACTPDLWRIHADGTKERLFTGFGVHVVYSGHDMHGVKIGPDGRLYWSIADCGAQVESREGKVFDVRSTGAVFRCELDGSRFEVVATGLRNPQSLAFNDVGDLFTGDNNADGGDKARWLHIVEGADYGWTLGWQFLPKLGAWNSEGMWHLDAAKNHIAVLPPAAHIGHGPAGIAYYPGTGLPETWREHFFYADFPGGIRAFKATPSGASYAVENRGDILQDNSAQKMSGKLLWGLYPSDVAFAPGGGIYVLDWVQGWEKTGKGRIFRVFDPATDASPAVQETRELLKSGFSARREAELAALLGHIDQRVRLGAQFELVRRGASAALEKSALAGSSRLARLHGIWGTGQLARSGKPAGNLAALETDPDSEVRAQWARFVGDARRTSDADALSALLADPEPRVRFFAAQALGQLGHKPAGAKIAQLKGADSDPFLRHAASLALARTAESGAIARRADGVALLALRHSRAPQIALLLQNASLALDAARAIHDAPIPAAWPALAEIAGAAGLPEPLWRRAVNANYLLGTSDAAARLGTVATDAKLPVAQRLFAIESLALWNAPFERDRVTGLWRELPPRATAQGAPGVAAKVVPTLLEDPSEQMRLAAANLAGALKVASAVDPLFKIIREAAAGGKVRAAALRALAAMKSPLLEEAVAIALSASDAALLEAGRKLAGQASPQQAVKVNAAVLAKGSIREQQEALANIAAQPGTEADSVIEAQLDLLIAGKLPGALWLDLLEAAAARSAPAIRAKITSFENTRKAGDPLGAWRECIEGGDARLGREIFYEKAEAGCLRCHKVKGEGGDVGPDMAGIAARMDREALLRAIVDPNASIAPGYENVLVTLADGSMVAGLLGAEDASTLTLKSIADGTPQKVEKANVKERMSVPSAMPPGLGEVLGKRGLRDLVAYLATLK
jgi:quinoprotein glucose dehydrogenase